MGLKYSIGTTKLVLDKNRIAPGEILKGSLSLILNPSVTSTQITVSLTGYEFTKSLLYEYKGTKYFTRYFTMTTSHPILNMNITSTSRGPTHHNFHFKLPEKLNPSLYASGKDFEVSHTYHIETCIKAWGINYISRHEIPVKSISYDYDEVEYSPPIETELVSTSKQANFNFLPVEATQESGIVNCSQIGVEGKFIDIEAVHDFTDEIPGKYVIRYGIMRRYDFINRLQMHSTYTETGYHERQKVDVEKSKIRFLMSIPVNDSNIPCYNGKLCSVENKVFFLVERIQSGREIELMKDTKAIPIKSSYNESIDRSTEAQLIHSFAQSYYDKHHVFADAIFFRLALSSGMLIYMYLSRPRGQKIKYLLEDEIESKEVKESEPI